MASAAGTPVFWMAALARLRAMLAGRGRGGWLAVALLLAVSASAGEGEGRRANAAAATERAVSARVRVATLNLENYLLTDRVVDGRFRPDYPKPEAEKAALRKVIRTVAPDVLAVQEIGGEAFLEELRGDLAREGFDLPHAAWLDAADPDRHIAVLSKIPFSEVRCHRDVRFRYFDDEACVKRGMLEVSFPPVDDLPAWTLFVVHLKSRYTEREDDPASQLRRAREARALRDIIRERFPDPTRARYLIAGDFNDSPGAAPVRAFLRCGDVELGRLVPAADSRGETWTHVYRREDIYSRVDYLIAAPGLWARVVGGSGRIFDGEGAREGSDHRLVFLDLSTVPAGPAEE